MAIVVEDGSVVSGANSYVTAQELTDYTTDRGVTLTGDNEEHLLNAMTYIETIQFIGYKKTKDQPLQWPREGAFIDGFEVFSNEIPQELKTLQFEVVIAQFEGNGPLTSVDRKISSAQVGSLSVSYDEGSAPYSYSRRLLAVERKLTNGGLGGLVRG